MTTVNQQQNTPKPINLQKLKTGSLPDGLHIATSKTQIRRIERFREAIFKALYPGMGDFRDDAHDAASLILYSENHQGDISGTVRIVFDGLLGLPADEYAREHLDKHRKMGVRLAELSRFAIAKEAGERGLVALYYRAVYALCAENGIDSMIIIIQQKSVAFHKKRIGAQLLMDDIGHHYGRDDLQFSCMQWRIRETRQAFFKWTGLKNTGPNSSAKKTPATIDEQDWNQYAHVFASVLSPLQRELYLDACQYLSGKVVDLGCGSARLAAYLADKPEISHYTGIEYARSMVELAQQTLDRLAKSRFTVQKDTIEAFAAEKQEGRFDAAVSLQNYYAWNEPQQTLHNIHGLLKPGGRFVIATVNPHYDQEKLFADAEKDLMWHPDFPTFKRLNRSLANNPQTRFVGMDALLKTLQQAGFGIELCHQRHFMGGLNFVLCSKLVR
jgi:SAM-dependent methyltransferase